MGTIRDIVMYEDVGFDQTHKHCLDFLSESDRDAYFDELRDKTEFADANYNKTEKTLNLACDWEDGLKFSYCSLMYGSKRMFFFVTGCKVVNDKVTGFELQMDMWQTFLFDFTVGEGMITRQHVDRWDSDGKILWRRGTSEDIISNYRLECNKINLVPENCRIHYTDRNDAILGIIDICFINNIGGSKKICHVFTFVPMSISNVNGQPIIDEAKNYVRVEVEDGITPAFSSHNMMRIGSIISGQFVSALVIPPESILAVSFITGLPANLIGYQQIYWNDSGEYPSFVIKGKGERSEIFKDEQGQKYFPHCKFTDTTGFWDSNNQPINTVDGTVGVYYCDTIRESLYINSTHPVGFNGFEVDYHFTRPIKPSNNDIYSPNHEPELFKLPYIKRSITGYNNNKIIDIPDLCWFDDYKPRLNIEFSNDKDNLMIVFADNNILHYNFNDYCVNGLATLIDSLSFDIISDNWATYVATQRDTDRQMLQSTINQQGISNAIGSIVGMGGISGMAGSGKGAGLGFNPIQAIAGAGIGAVMSGASYLANQHFGWEQQNIKEQAIKNQPSMLLANGNGESILTRRMVTPFVMEQKCNESSYNQASERFHKYGYLVNMASVPNIRTRKYFNYVETSQIRVEGSMNQAIRDEIANIFNNGVTIWHGENITKETGSNKFITDYTMENIERTLI